MATSVSCDVNLPQLFLEGGLLLTEEAYVKLLEDNIPLDRVREYLSAHDASSGPLVTKDAYEDFFYPLTEPQEGHEEPPLPVPETPCVSAKPRERPEPRTSVKVKHIPAKDVDPDIKILKDVSGKDDSEGSLDDFLSLFRDRYRKISRIFKEHADLRDFIPIKNAKTQELKSAVKIVGLVQEKSTTKNGNIILELEDMSGSIKVLVSTGKERLIERAKYIMRDEVIGIIGVLGDDIVFANDVQFPDISVGRPRNQAPCDINAIFTSDIHVGSNEFAEKSFLRFIKWLRLEMGSEKQQELAAKVKYVVVTGDVVDGIGIYPNQDKELTIKDIYQQYEETAKLFSYFPDWIEIIVSPGNHDATRSGNPQLPIPKQFAYGLYENSAVHMISNPSYFSLHDVRCLTYHGDSIFDFLSQIPGFEYTDCVAPMTEMLRKRHLAPLYGMGTQIIPEQHDFLCIEEPPDIFHTGHTHMYGSGTYRNITLINGGGWQAQTEYQKLRNITPDVGRVPIINLQSHKMVVMNFGD